MAEKTDEQLDCMVPHIRYEVLRLLDFLAIKNGWVSQIEGLRPEVANFAAVSMLEAALIHTRCVAEFLRRTDQDDDVITAKDYVRWHWIEGERLSGDIGEIHGRVAHLGLIRCSVQRDDAAFRWDNFLRRDAVPTLLGGFRKFLALLSAERVEQFNQPDADHEWIDLDAAIVFGVEAAGRF